MADLGPVGPHQDVGHQRFREQRGVIHMRQRRQQRHMRPLILHHGAHMPCAHGPLMAPRGVERPASSQRRLSGAPFIALTAFFLSLGVPKASTQHATKAPWRVCTMRSRPGPASVSTASATAELGAACRYCASSLPRARRAAQARASCCRRAAARRRPWRVEGRACARARRPAAPSP